MESIAGISTRGAAALNLTDDQQSRFQEMSREDAPGFRSSEERTELERQQNEEFFAVLTEEQRQTWLELVSAVVVDNGTPRN